MTTKKPLEPKTIEDVKKLAEKATKDWIVENTGDVKTLVYRILNKQVDSVIAKTLGFRKTYGEEWEVDYMNGRTDKSILGEFMRNEVGDAVNKWIREQVGALPDLPKAAIASVRREYVDEYKDTLGRRVREIARDNAGKDVYDYIKDLTEGESEEENNG